MNSEQLNIKIYSDETNPLLYAIDRTIFVYSGIHRIFNKINTEQITLRTSNLTEYKLVVDVLQVCDHYIYAICCENLPQNRYLLARLLPVEILNNQDNSWVQKMVEYGIIYTGNKTKIRRKQLRNLILYNIYSQNEVLYLLSQLKEKTSSYNYWEEDKKYISDIANIIPKLDSDTVINYNPDKVKITVQVRKKSLSQLCKFHMFVLSDPNTIIKIPIYYSPINDEYILEQSTLKTYSTILIKIDRLRGHKNLTNKEKIQFLLQECGYYQNIHIQNKRRQFLYDLLQFNLVQPNDLFSLFRGSTNNYMKSDMCFLETIPKNRLQDFLSKEYYKNTLLKLVSQIPKNTPEPNLGVCSKQQISNKTSFNQSQLPSTLSSTAKNNYETLSSNQDNNVKTQDLIQMLINKTLDMSDLYLYELYRVKKAIEENNNQKILLSSICKEINKRVIGKNFSFMDDTIYIVNLSKRKLDYSNISFFEVSTLTGDLKMFSLKLMFDKKRNIYMLSTDLWQKYINQYHSILLKFQPFDIYVDRKSLNLENLQLLYRTGYWDLVRKYGDKISCRVRHKLINNIISFRILSVESLLDSLQNMGKHHPIMRAEVEADMLFIEEMHDITYKSYHQCIVQQIKQSNNVSIVSNNISNSVINAQSNQPHIRTIEFNPKHLHTVYLYSHRNTLRDEDYEMVNILVRCANCEDIVPITVYHSKSEDKYFLNSETYLLYKKKYGLPYIRLEYYHIPDIQFHMKEKSDLRLYGYSVSKTDGLPQKERQELIGQLISAGLMEQYQIINHLEWLIRTHNHDNKYDDACNAWRNDLEFTYSYTQKSNYSTVFDIEKAKS